MFVMTEEWLQKYYGSEANQVDQTKNWLLQYNGEATIKQMEEWKYYKHLAEYSVNTLDIVQQCLDKITGLFDFGTELQTHRFVNMLRVPLSASYEDALAEAKPRTILELGIGGDSAISTAVFLAYVEKVNGQLFSVDLNPLGKTKLRYEQFIGKFWNFKYDDSVSFLNEKKAKEEAFDLIFIDTSHTYEHTKNEMKIASQITRYMLMDDALFEGNAGTTEIPGGVKRAIQEWMENHKDWEKKDFWGGNTVLLSKRIENPTLEKKNVRKIKT